MEKRKELRIKRRLLARLDEHSALTCDISANGFQLSMGANPKSVMVDIIFTLEKSIFKLKGKVKWIKRNSSKNTSTIGINIKDLSEDYKKKLSDLFPALANGNSTEVEVDEINSIFGV